jgi:LacI family transcriptional regulator
LKQDKIVPVIYSFLEKNPTLDAVLFATNYLAVSGLEAINQLQRSIPDDIAVIGFDDNTHFSLFSPAVTAVAQPVQEISETVIRKLIGALSDGKTPEKATVVLPAQLVVRASSLRRAKMRRAKAV